MEVPIREQHQHETKYELSYFVVSDQQLGFYSIHHARFTLTLIHYGLILRFCGRHLVYYSLIVIMVIISIIVVIIVVIVIMSPLFLLEDINEVMGEHNPQNGNNLIQMPPCHHNREKQCPAKQLHDF